MASSKDQSPTTDRLFLLIALLALSVSAAIGFGRVFQGTSAVVRLGAAAAAATLLAAAMSRRHILLATALSAAGLAVAVGLLVLPATTKFGLPTMTTMRVAWHALHAVGPTAAVQVAPAQPVPPLLLAAVLAAWTSAFAAHALAVRARSPFLAILPPACLLAFAGIVLVDGARPSYVVLFLASALAVLFADALRRVGTWGPVSLWHDRRSLRFGSSANTRAARRVAVACLGLAAFAPLFVPGLRSAGLISLEGGPAAVRVSVNPIVDLRASLNRGRPVQLFTVQTTDDRPSYWRFVALDQFNGQQWTASNLDATNGFTLTSGPIIVPQALGPPAAAGVGHVLNQHFEFDRLAQKWLPAAYLPVAVSLPGTIRYDPVTAEMVSTVGTYPGFSYDVTSTIATPSPEQLDAVTSFSAVSNLAFLTRLPSNTPSDVYQIADRLTAQETTPYRKILAVQDYLRQFTYDIHARAGHDVNHLLYFLTKSHRGFCEQFAGSMAVLLRALGIPARVAVGFTPGQFDAKAHLYRVDTDNTHAWVEVLFPGYGWLPFEPTPTRTNPAAVTYVAPPFAGTIDHRVLNCAEDLNSEACSGRHRGEQQEPTVGGGSGLATKIDTEINQGLGAQGTSGLAAVVGGGRWRGLALGAGLALAVLLILSIPLSKAIRRRTLLARSHRPGQRVLALYEVMTDRAGDLGLGRLPSETMREYRDRLTARGALSNGDLDALTLLASRAAYGDADLSSAEAREAARRARTVQSDLRRGVGFIRRLAGWFRIERYSLAT